MGVQQSMRSVPSVSSVPSVRGPSRQAGNARIQPSATPTGGCDVASGMNRGALVVRRQDRYLGAVRAAAAAVRSESSESSESSNLRCAIDVWEQPKASKMTRGSRAFQEEHRIRGYEVGPDQKTTMITIANLLQEVASNHVVSMWGRSEEGFATDPEMAKDNLIFVMTRMQVQMDSYPKWGDMVRFETWFAMTGRMRASREWSITDCATGERIGRATSTWVTINMKTRRLGKIADHTRERLATFQYTEENAFDPGKMQLKLPDLTSETEVDVKVPQIARVSDMDMNGHINNVTYINWILETIPEQVLGNKRLYQIEIDYKNECTSGDLVHPRAEACEVPEAFMERGCRVEGDGCKGFLHSLSRNEGQGEAIASKELVRARTLWV